MNIKKIQAYIKQNKEELKREGLQLHDDHPLPITRRDLLASGFISAASFAVMPSLGSLLLASKAEAQAAEVLSGTPFLQLHLGGGANFFGWGIAPGLAGDGDPGNFTPKGGIANAGDLFAFGCPDELHPLNRPYAKLGQHAVHQHSHIMQSFKTVMGESFNEVNNNLLMLSFCGRSPDDSRNTHQGKVQFVSQLRGDEASLANIVSNTSGTDSSGLSNKPSFGGIQSSHWAKVFRSNDNISSLVQTGLGNNAKQNNKFLDYIQDLISHRVSSQDTFKAIGESKQKAQSKLTEFLGREINIFNEDPLINSNFGNNADGQLANFSYMLRNGLVSAAGLSLGGYDYHGGGSSGYLRDVTAYTRIARVVKYFHDADTPAVILVTSDGSVSCNKSIQPQTVMIDGVETEVNLGTADGDRGRNGATLCLVVGAKHLDPELVKFLQSGFCMPDGGVSREPGFAYDTDGYSKVVGETVRRLQEALGQKPLKKTFQEATGGSRLDDSLEQYIPIKKVS